VVKDSGRLSVGEENTIKGDSPASPLSN
jgi:hypothetical protein